MAGGVAAFAVYTFGWQKSESEPKADVASTTNDTGRHHLYTLRQGDAVRVPATGTVCEASGEGGFPNLFCTHAARSRSQVVFYSDSVLVFDLARHGEPLAPTFSVPAELKPGK